MRHATQIRVELRGLVHGQVVVKRGVLREVADARPRLAAGRYVQVTVADQGLGIPAKHLGRIFDPYFSTKAAGRGTGLGLSITRSVVTEHGGSIHVRSTPGTGSVFTVELPLSPSASE